MIGDWFKKKNPIINPGFIYPDLLDRGKPYLAEFIALIKKKKKNYSFTFKSFKCMTSGLLQNSAEKSFRHLAKVSCLAEEKSVWPHKSPQRCFHLGQGKQYSHIFTPACLLKNPQRRLPHHIWHSCVSSGSAGWFEEDLSSLDTQRALWLKPQSYFPTIPGRANVLSPKRWATCHQLCLN